MFNDVDQQIGNYRVLRVLGQGAFALVYLGEHRYLKSAAALKVLRISLSEQEVQHFLQEAQLLVRLRHAHIVRVLDFAVERDTPVLIMDYLPGGTVRQRYPIGTRLSLAKTTDYITQLASALQYAHNHRLIHRDVKPDNILLDDEQQLLLSDFGLAILAPSIDQFNTQPPAGTPAYLAPEQIRGKPVFASDQYALGVLAYEWLTGARPFQGRTWELMQQHLMQAPPPLRERCPDLPVAVEQVVLRALAKDPRERYVSVSAFALALQRVGQADGQDEDESQITAPIRVVSHLSTIDEVTSQQQIHLSRVIFLSIAPGDEQMAARLTTDLTRRGIVIFRDAEASGAELGGVPREAMRTVQHVVVLGTPKTRSSRLIKEHLRLAQMYQRPLVLVWLQGGEVASLLLEPMWQPFLPVDVVDARDARYHTALDELLVCLREGAHISTDQGITLSTEDLREPRNPYKGLRAFHQEDTSDFFGRDTLIQEATKRITSMLETEQRGGPAVRLVTFIGASGSGKSSVVLAGLLPYLQAGAVSGSESWVYLEPCMPGIHPIEALSLTLAPHFPHRSVHAMYEDLHDDSSRGLHRLASQLVKRPNSRMVLVVDQFEELFTQTVSEEERQHFIDLLLVAVTEVAGPVLVVLTLRADFYDRLMDHSALYRLTQKHLIPVLPMDIYDLRSIIEEPAALPDVQITFEGNLVGDLLFEAQGQVGALPLLEFTLDQLFQRRSGRQHTLQAYKEIGGVKGALVTHAEAVYTTLPSQEHQFLARILFLRLIEPGTSEQDTTRRRAALAELSLSDARQTSMLREVADAFITARLLMTNEVAGMTTIEVSHEALIRSWPRLTAWVREGRDDVLLQHTVSQDVAEWEYRGRPQDRLYRGTQLKEARVWIKRSMPSEQESAFFNESMRQQKRSRMSVMAVLLLLLLLLVPTGFFAFQLLFPAIPPNLVRNLNDTGDGSLRQVIANATEGSTITFDTQLTGKTIELTHGSLFLNKHLTIKGLGANRLAISSGTHGYYIYVAPSGSVAITDLTIKDSSIQALNKSMITNDGQLTLTNCIMSGNRVAFQGGAIYNHGTLTLVNSIISGNTAGRSGGGIYNVGHANLTLMNSVISHNIAARSAGGIDNTDYGTLNITNSTISDNSALKGAGGGLYNAFTSILLLNTSTVFGNQAPQSSGGGIYSYNSIVEITFSTIAGNKSNTGGGIMLDINKLSTIGEVKVRGSIVAGNSAGDSPDIFGTVTTANYNLIQNPSGATLPSDPFSVIGLSPLLASLHMNGGFTQTVALLQNSPVIDRVPTDTCLATLGPGKTFDQRGVKRPQGPACDIGAYEASS